MKLKEYLQTIPRSNISLLWFDGEKLESRWYNMSKFNKVKQQFLDMEFMECVEEDDCKEIWIR